MFPLHLLPEDVRTRIEAEAASDAPPSRWLSFTNDRGDRPYAQIRSRGFIEWCLRRGIDPNKRTRDKVSPAMRRKIIARDGLVCGICRTTVDERDVHIDHIKALARGGQTVATNLRVTHSVCNMRKGAR